MFPALSQNGVTSFLGLPIISKGKALGVINYYSCSSQVVFDMEVMHLMQTVCSQLANMIENATMFREAQQMAGENQARAQRFATLYNVRITSYNVCYTKLLRDGNSEAGTEFNPKVAFFQEIPGTGARVRAAVGRGFRVPTLLEKSDPFIGNEELDPETVISWEAGADAALFGGRWTVSATWFYQDFHDLIQFDESVAGPVGFGQLRNVGKAFSRGVEAEARASLLEALSLLLVYTYSRITSYNVCYTKLLRHRRRLPVPEGRTAQGGKSARRPAQIPRPPDPRRRQAHHIVRREEVPPRRAPSCRGSVRLYRPSKDRHVRCDGVHAQRDASPRRRGGRWCGAPRQACGKRRLREPSYNFV